jgi:phosphohistidine phosphatase
VTNRRLIVMRHAKAEPFAASDRARELTRKGQADATDAGDYLASARLVPDYAIVSPAARTRATWNAVASASGSQADAVFDEALYSGGVDGVLAALHVVPEDVSTVIFVGHNPTAEYLAHILDDGNGEPAAVTEMLAGYPTSALTVLDVDVPWSDLAEGVGPVRPFHIRRGD